MIYVVCEITKYVPPETGASTKAQPFSSATTPTSMDVCGSVVLQSMNRLPGTGELQRYQ